MRYLLYFTIGFAGSCAACAYLLESFPLGAAAALGICILFGCWSRREEKARKYVLIFLGVLTGFLWYAGFQSRVLDPLEPLDGQIRTLTVTLSETPGKSGFGCSADAMTVLDGQRYRTRIFLEQPESLGPGDTLRGAFQLKVTGRPGDPIPGYHAGRGIFLLADQNGELLIQKGSSDRLRYLPARLRSYAETVFSDFFSPETGGFARALFLGDSSQLDFRTEWSLRISGIRHMIAVSGLHVSILCLLVSLLAGRNRFLTFFLGCPAMTLFAAMAGFSPSVTRACMMMLLMLAAGILKRPYDGLTGLAAAVLVMLIKNPLTVTDLSFQLSVASVMGILLFNGPILNLFLGMIPSKKGKLRKFLLKICSGLSISLSSMVFVTPLTALHFGSVSLIAPLTNLLTVWLMPVIFGGILLVLILSTISWNAAWFLASGVSLLIRYVLGISEWISRFPLAAVYPRAVPVAVWIAGIYLLALLLLGRKRKRIWWFLGTAAAGLVLALGLSWGIPATDTVRLTVLDVGQGQCVLLQSEGKNFLVDCGGSRPEDAAEAAGETLLSQGVFHLDGLILTHTDRDHVGGAGMLLDILDADRIYLPKGHPLPPDERILLVDGETVLAWDDTVLTICGRAPGAPENEMSLAVLLDSPGYDILITGDRGFEGEQELLRNHRLPRVDCLIAGHHGAETSTSEELLNRVRPDTVIISAGAGNPYGHPSLKTLQRLQKFGCQVLRTDLSGTITIRR